MSDAQFLAEYEALTWPEAEWHHREHVRLAYLYLRQLPFDAAMQKVRASLQAYNAKHNVPETLERGYHETLTFGWMKLVECALLEYGPSETADAFLDKHTQLLSRRALLLFYSRDRLMSWDAKRVFVEPDLAPLPRSTKALR